MTIPINGPASIGAAYDAKDYASIPSDTSMLTESKAGWNARAIKAVGADATVVITTEVDTDRTLTLTAGELETIRFSAIKTSGTTIGSKIRVYW